MPECRKCHEKIDYLLQTKTVREYYNTRRSWDEKMDNIQYYKTVSRQYYCPRCQQLLYTKESTALEFLGINETSEW